MDFEKLFSEGLDLVRGGKMTEAKFAKFIKAAYVKTLKQTSDIELVPMSVVADESLAKIHANMTGNGPKGLKTRFPFLNDALGLVQKDITHIIGARPGKGKTAFNIILNDDIPELNPNVEVASIGLNFEMANYQSFNRYLSKRTKLTLHQLMSIREPLSQQMYDMVVRAGNSLKSRKHFYMLDIPVEVDKIENLVIEFALRFEEECEQEGKEGHVLLNLDHTLLPKKGKEKNNQELVQNVSKSMLRIKKIAHTSNFILSQLKDDSIKEERRKTYFRPLPSDLVWSSELEHDSEVIMLLHTPADFGFTEYPVGDKKIPTKIKDPDDARVHHKVTVCELAKNRYGSPGMIFFKENLKHNDLTEINFTEKLKAPK